MSLRTKGLVGAAAVAALAMSGWVRAADTAQQPYMLAEAADKTPLMALLDSAGLAKPLEDAGITVGGYVQGSYTYGFDKPEGNTFPGRYFDFENQDPTLNQVNLFIDKAVATDKFDIGGRIEWIYGADSRRIHALGLFDHHGINDGPDNWFDLFQAYVDVNLPVGNGLKVRAGKFGSPIGYEAINPTANDLYSHTFSFGYGVPFTHTGVTVSTALSDKLTVTGGITRGWDVSTEDDNDAIDFLGQLSYVASDKNTINLNFLIGPDQPGSNDDYRVIVDFQYIRQVADNFKFVFNAIYAWEQDSTSSLSGSEAQWFAVVAYGTLGLTDNVSLTGRVEYFNDQDGARLTGSAGGTSLYDATIGLAIKPFPADKWGQGLIIRPEIRLDYSEKAFFDGGDDNIQVTAAIDAIYKF
jgi:hypothetical protein